MKVWPKLGCYVKLGPSPSRLVLTRSLHSKRGFSKETAVVTEAAFGFAQDSCKPGHGQQMPEGTQSKAGF